MNPQVKSWWLEDLRSGKYQQCEGALTKNNRYCCLGVLADRAAKEGVCEKFVEESHISLYTDQLADTVCYFDGKDEFLPESVVQWAGISKDTLFKQSGVSGTKVFGGLDIIIGGGADGHITLSMLNDEGKSFQEIADIIEEKL
jgi:hypothetical protein